MKFQLDMTVCDISQGPVTGDSFAECLGQLMLVMNDVPEQFPSSYIAAALNCARQIADKLADVEHQDLESEMNGTISGDSWADHDFIVLTFGESEECH